MSELSSKYKYEVALSFAGEQRTYVEEVASILKEAGVSVYYDADDEIESWGSNLVDRFGETYGEHARYVVMFISKEYAEKAWTNHERQTILARRLKDEKFLLPVRFDDTKIDGLPETVMRINLRGLSPKDLADKITQKIRKEGTSKNSRENNDFKLPQLAKSINPYRERTVFIETVVKELEQRCKRVPDLDFYQEDRGDKVQMRIMYKSTSIYALDIHKSGISDDQGIAFSFGGVNGGYNAWGDFEWGRESNGPVIKVTGFAFSSFEGERKITYLDFANEVWDQIIKKIEDFKY
jgi:hypothetical protein